ncbi:hypothetical protein [Citrobacter gillenii]|uniref:Type VI secretion system baseplate subunit TssE n=1 Tax=Citrobacter gillenii TaxID=67828 RepID=A0ABD6M6W9_9ENTR|nr:hypothetical protein [Citrobacter gillenii]NTZ52934.1 hypothetical protein [Citrobacter gillenii]
MTSSLLSKLRDDHPLHAEDDFLWEKLSHADFLSELKMLLTSRIRQPEIESIPQINSSILNYGIDESFSKINEVDSRLPTMEIRLSMAIARFEPRLTHLTLQSFTDDLQAMTFIINANYMHKRITLELRWDDCTGRFYFNE